MWNEKCASEECGMKSVEVKNVDVTGGSEKRGTE